jgi:NADPH:quinone reductase-like Zn-dependent oxidoreductase
MKAVRYHEYGGPGVLELDDVERPTVESDQLLVDVRAASVNPVDALYRRGVIGGGDGAFEGSELPAVTGTDFAGEVAAVGDDVEGFEPGDRVFGTGLADSPHATVADYAVVPADHAATLPSTVDFEQGAGVAHVGGTAWRALIHFGEITPGQRVLIHGASGGVGHIAVQVAAAAGARVVGTVGFARARETVSQLGADVVVDYDRDDLGAAIRDGAKGAIDVILDPHTEEYLPLDVELAAAGGRITHLNGAFPAMAQPAATRTKELTIQGVAMHNTPDVGAALAKLTPLLESGAIRVTIDRTYPLREAARAQRALEEEHVVGKVVITID